MTVAPRPWRKLPAGESWATFASSLFASVLLLGLIASSLRLAAEETVILESASVLTSQYQQQLTDDLTLTMMQTFKSEQE